MRYSSIKPDIVMVELEVKYITKLQQYYVLCIHDPLKTKKIQI